MRLLASTVIVLSLLVAVMARLLFTQSPPRTAEVEMAGQGAEVSPPSSRQAPQAPDAVSLDQREGDSSGDDGVAVASPPGVSYIVNAGRSPLLQPGETMEKPLPLRRLDGQPAGAPVMPSSPAPPPGAIIPWTDAGQYVGHTITVEGQVVRTRRSGSVVFLNFTEDWRDRFYVILFRGVLGSWPEPPQQYFLDKTVHVTGKVVLRAMTPQIQVNNADQIQVVTTP